MSCNFHVGEYTRKQFSNIKRETTTHSRCGNKIPGMTVARRWSNELGIHFYPSTSGYVPGSGFLRYRRNRRAIRTYKWKMSKRNLEQQKFCVRFGKLASETFKVFRNSSG